MLPWRRREVDLLPFTRSADELLARTRRRARAPAATTCSRSPGASNVTGEIMPLRELAELAHLHGAEICVDAAQLAPHVPIDMHALGIDHLALSGHKLYAPFGAGVLVARGRRIASAEPLLHGGGAVARVLDDRVVWSDAPGALRGRHAQRLRRDRARRGLRCARGPRHAPAGRRGARARRAPARAARRRSRRAGARAVGRGDAPRVALTSFHAPSIEAGEIARRLAEEHAISVRSGAFCAHPLVRHLRASSRGAGAGAVRASLGIGSGIDDVEALADALGAVLAGRPRLMRRPRPVARFAAPVAGLLHR